MVTINGPHARLQTVWRLMVVGIVLAGGVQSASASASPAEVVVDPAVQVVDLNPGAAGSSPSGMTAIGSAVFFRADDDETGQELWMSLPPYIDAIQVADINPGDGGSWPEELTVHGSSLFFTADDGTSGRELWVAQPPFNSARRVADINPGSDSSNPHELTPVGTALIFAADDGSTGVELWKTQDPFNTAVLAADIFAGGPSSSPSDIHRIGWNLFFSASLDGRRELWMMGPPYTGAEQVTDINPDAPADPEEITLMGDMIFFTAVDPEYGREMWLAESPYNPLSTRPLNDFETRWYNSNPYDLYVIEDTIFFSASIGLIGVEPWKSIPPYDTTHTTRVGDLNEPFFQSSFPDNKTSIGETLFFTAFVPKDGVEVWRSNPPYDDDTTFQIEQINYEELSSNPEQLTPAGNVLFFTADDGEHGREVWRSLAPYTSAELVQDIWRGARSSSPESLLAVGSSLFFRATTPADGAELWRIADGSLLPNTGFAPGIVTPLQPQPARLAYQDVGQMALEIPSLAVNTPIIGIPAIDQGWDLTWLGSRAGYLEGTAFPTWNGNTALTGHAYLSGGDPGPFARLDQLSYGSAVIIHAWGQQYRYEVRSVEQVDPNDRTAFKHEELDWITLITCKGFDEATGAYRSRIVVRAVLVNVEAAP